MVNHWYQLDQRRLVDRRLCFDMINTGLSPTSFLRSSGMVYQTTLTLLMADLKPTIPVRAGQSP